MNYFSKIEILGIVAIVENENWNCSEFRSNLGQNLGQNWSRKLGRNLGQIKIK